MRFSATEQPGGEGKCNEISLRTLNEESFGAILDSTFLAAPSMEDFEKEVQESSKEMAGWMMTSCNTTCTNYTSKLTHNFSVTFPSVRNKDHFRVSFHRSETWTRRWVNVAKARRAIGQIGICLQSHTACRIFHVSLIGPHSNEFISQWWSMRLTVGQKQWLGAMEARAGRK